MKTFDGVVDTDRVTRNECDLLKTPPPRRQHTTVQASVNRKEL